jgi:putative transposase
MEILKGYKVEVSMNNRQKTLFNKTVGCGRFAYNWGLQKCIERYELEGKIYSAIDLHKEIVVMKHTEEYKWLQEVTKCSPQEALRDLEKAYKNFFRSVKNKDGKFRLPTFHSKHSVKQSFRVTGSIHVFDKHIKFPTFGKVRMKEAGYIPKDLHILSATMSKENSKYFISIQCSEDKDMSNIEINHGEVIGIDLGIKDLMICSDGTVIENPKFLNKYEKKLKRTQRKISKKFQMNKNGNTFVRTKNIEKLQKKLNNIWFRIKCLRNDYIHKATSNLVKTKPEMLVAEDLGVSNMIRNHHLAKSIQNAMFGEIYRQLAYKCKWNGIKFVTADKFYPSSKTCSKCGNIKEDLTLKDRIYACPHCGNVIDRDLNASVNLMHYGKMQLVTV